MAGDEHHSTGDPLADAEEQRVLHAALDSFRQYRQAAHFNITHLRRQSFYSLPSAHIDLLSQPPFELPSFFRSVDAAIDSNADIADAIYENGLQMFGLDPADESLSGKATPLDMDKARSTIRQLYRDWSAEGVAEREASYRPIMDALAKYIPSNPASRHRYSILVPGAGLGRLLFDLVNAGYRATGNEVSYHQILASAYILNATHSAGQHILFPWALNFSNHLTRGDELKEVQVPDIHLASTLEATTPSEVHWSQRMAMASGDFCVVYKQAEYRDTFDAIDTAPNLIYYIEAIRHCLKVGGIWINHGPLLWHFESSPIPAERAKAHGHEEDDGTPVGGAGIGEAGSFELTDEDVKHLVVNMGFEILEAMQSGPTGYIQDPRSMLQNYYRPSFWVARKT